MDKQIFITMEGGVLQNIDVTRDLKNVEITVIDLDTHGASTEIVKKTPRGDKALIYGYPSNIIGDRSSITFWKDILKRK